MKDILLVSSGWFHPPLLGRYYLYQALSKMDGYRYKTVSSLENLSEDLSPYSALLLYFHRKRISDRTLQAVDDYVRGGGGLLALHSATASYKNSPHYFEILGGRFTGHGAVETFEIVPVSASQVFNGIPSFRVKDELYLHERRPEIEVHFFSRQQDQEVPVVWTQRYGQGRVCYAVPGHCAATLQNPVFRQVIERGLSWVVQK